MPATEARLDKWLWCVRIFRTRSLATAACQEGRIQVNQQPAKPARSVRPGDLITAEQGGLTRTLKVLGLPDSRVGAKLVPQHLEDLTPPEELAKEPQMLDRDGRVIERPTLDNIIILEFDFGLRLPFSELPLK